MWRETVKIKLGALTGAGLSYGAIHQSELTICSRDISDRSAQLYSAFLRLSPPSQLSAVRIGPDFQTEPRVEIYNG